jgi:hypothetical protein
MLFRGSDGITVVILNFSLLFQTNNPNNSSTIRNIIIFLLFSRQPRNHYFLTILICYNQFLQKTWPLPDPHKFGPTISNGKGQAQSLKSKLFWSDPYQTPLLLPGHFQTRLLLGPFQARSFLYYILITLKKSKK